jgi:lincosamide nucleotidyltransferase A/C/D/E
VSQQRDHDDDHLLEAPNSDKLHKVFNFEDLYIMGIDVFEKGGTHLTAEEVVELYNRLERLGVKIWIDGGWGVDALLGKQTRPHEDLDIVIQQKDLPILRNLLEDQGYTDVPRDDTSDWNFVLGDDRGHLVDVHVIVFDEEKNGIYGPVERGVMYPAKSLTGTGVIGDQTVRCISAEDMVRFHTGYELKESDYRDVSALCEKFGIDLPQEYEKFKK